MSDISRPPARARRPVSAQIRVSEWTSGPLQKYPTEMFKAPYRYRRGPFSAHGRERGVCPCRAIGGEPGTGA